MLKKCILCSFYRVCAPFPIMANVHNFIHKITGKFSFKPLNEIGAEKNRKNEIKAVEIIYIFVKARLMF